MMKNLLFLMLLFLFSFGLNAQEESKRDIVTNTDQDNISITKITAYPNPFSENSKITFSSKISQNVYFEVKNILGKSVYKYRLTAEIGINEIIFHRHKLLKGMYLYTLQTDSEVVSKRLVIK